MKRFFVLDKFNTWYDWRLILTAKSTPAPEPKTNYVQLDGVSGSLDLSEALTGEVTYGDRTVTASFSASEGDYNSRERLHWEIKKALHGRKIALIEPDDPDHYFMGRVKVLKWANSPAYATFDIEATCEPWRYAVNESERSVDTEGERVGVVIVNRGDKTVVPTIKTTDGAAVTANGVLHQLEPGEYRIADLRLKPGPNLVDVVGDVTFTYREASL